LSILAKAQLEVTKKNNEAASRLLVKDKVKVKKWKLLQKKSLSKLALI
jgi:hypothetical protein